jgi:hypothetical protein
MAILRNTPSSTAVPKASDNLRQEREAALHSLIEQYENIKGDTKAAQAHRIAFLNAIREEPHLLPKEPFFHFLAHVIEADDFAALEWDTPDHMLSFCDSLYQCRFQDEALAAQFAQHARLLLQQALHHHEKEGELEKMFQLMRQTPAHLRLQDDELSRLHHRAIAYEIRRTTRNRRFLFAYLVVQVFLVIIVFPLLFINAENGRIQKQVEQLANVELGDEGYQLISYSEGLYWAVITATSIGYGDVTPTTTTGRIIAALLGTMGVITVGILAGLILDWITPRHIK